MAELTKFFLQIEDKMKTLLILLSCLCFICSCDKGDQSVDENGIITNLDYNWKLSRLDADHSYREITTDRNVVHNGSAIVSFRNTSGNMDIRKVDKKNGNVLWRWDDFLLDDEIIHLGEDAIIIGNKLMSVIGSRHYFIDLNSGKTIWKHRTDFSSRIDLGVISNHYYFIASFKDAITFDTSKTFIYQGDLNTGNIEPYLNYTDNITSGDLTDTRVTTTSNLECFSKDGEDYILLDGRDPHPGRYDSQRHISLYNITEESWVYEKIPIGKIEGNNSGNLIVKEDGVYLAAGRLIESYDLMSGVQKWSNEFPHTFGFSGIIVVNDKVIGNCENRILYCMDAETGTTIWRGEGAGTSCDLIDRELNGVLYFIGGAPNRLFSIDINTGKTLWKVKASEYEEFDVLWEKDLYVIPASDDDTGKVITCTFKNAYCFDIIQ